MRKDYIKTIIKAIPASKQDVLTNFREKLKTIYINRELVQILECMVWQVKPPKEKKLLLAYLKKELLQTLRAPDKMHYEAFKEMYNTFFDEIQDEQRFYDPIKWIDAELEFIAYCNDDQGVIEKYAFLNNKWLSKEQLMVAFDFSPATLKRREADGLPSHRIGEGKKALYDLMEVTEWIKDYNTSRD